jgi:dephospho-CoA kinase
MKVIGLTGGIATGKSTVSDMFRQFKIPVVDTDEIAKNLMEIGTPTYQEVVDEFGKEYTLPSGHLNRKKLGALIFNNDIERLKLNNIVHPKVRMRCMEAIQSHSLGNTDAIVLDVPLLFESNFDDLCDLIICVSVDRDTQLERLMKRDDIDEETALNKMRAQMNLKRKEALSDIVIDNSGTILDTKKKLVETLDKFEIKK